MAPDLSDRADLLIVGAGVAGLYTAWRTLEAHPDARVLVLERLNRVGGRLQSDIVEIETDASPTGSVEVRDEEGGMRFEYHMEELMDVFGALGLCDQVVPFPMAPTKSPSGETAHNFFHFRGREFTAAEATADPAIWGQIYHLDATEKGKQPFDIANEMYQRVFEANQAVLAKHGYPTIPANPTPEYWQLFRTVVEWESRPLYDWQMWGLMMDMGYTVECCTMLAHTLGFEDTFWSPNNAGESFQELMDFPADPVYYTFERGFSTLVDALRDRVDALGGRIVLSANVDALDGGFGEPFRAEVTVAPEGQVSGPTVPGGRKATVEAEKVVLALPRLAIEGLFATSPALNHRHSEDPARQRAADRLRAALPTVSPEVLLKLNLYFDHAWWQTLDPPLTYGPSFTDLPVNAVYPFYSLRGVETDRTAGEPPDPALPAALTIYCDWDNATFWQGLQNVGPMFDSPLQRTYAESPQTIYPASQAAVKRAKALIRDLYQADHVPEPILTSYRYWDGEGPFGVATHAWGLGADDSELIPYLAQPFEDAELYTCNEAYSDMQAWVNGSLRSANHVLPKLGAEPPPTAPCSDAWTKPTDQALKPLVGGGRWGLGVPRSADSS